ncbi:MAG TPA: hypothetical protein VHB21_09820 [Minicystis sp.]|nr:hypothetical protein [Minicystis sp.]
MSPVRSARSPLSPPPPAGFGVAIRIDASSGRTVAHGTFRIPRADADALGGSAQRALVAVAAVEGRVAAWRVWGEQATFEDDEDRGPSTVQGHFAFDLDEAFPLGAGERAWLHVVLGAHASDVATWGGAHR